MKTFIAPGHDRWLEFLVRLEGPDGCDMRHTPEGSFRWSCDGDTRRAESILRSMGSSDRQLAASLSYFRRHGGYCDCEVLLNVDRSQETTGR